MAYIAPRNPLPFRYRPLARIDGKRLRAPWYKPDRDVLSETEIRFWLNELRYRHGWTNYALAKLLGLKHSSYVSTKAAGTNWIYRTEQLRWSRVLKRIIAGELIYIPAVPKRIIPRIPAHAEVVAIPVPLPQPSRSEFDFKTGKLKRIYPRREGESRIPSFQKALENAGRWRECTFPEDERCERDP